MNLMVRPSKSFLFDVLESRLSGLNGAVGVDAGSANFKNRRMFKTARYYGLDRDVEMLKRGLAKYQDENTLAIRADLTVPPAIPENSADVVVSTNTMNHLAAQEQNIAIEFLCQITTPTGYFLCETSLDENFEELLHIVNSYFADTRVIYYRNFVSRLYEWIFERDGDLGTHPIAGQRAFRLLAWLISRLEFLTCLTRFGNRHAFIVARNKPGRTTRQFDLSGLSLNGRIYEAL